jgi:hypothetical protein
MKFGAIISKGKYFMYLLRRNMGFVGQLFCSAKVSVLAVNSQLIDQSDVLTWILDSSGLGIAIHRSF